MRASRGLLGVYLASTSNTAMGRSPCEENKEEEKKTEVNIHKKVNYR